MPFDLPQPDRLAAYHDARKRLRSATETAGCVALSAEDARALLRGYPPEAELPNSYCEFSATFVPFLRCVGDHASPITVAGITVTAHPDGGAVLVATDGHVMMMARDPSARVSVGGVRLLMPAGALDACNPPPGASLWWDGDPREVVPPSPMTVPDRVVSIGAALLVMPKGQPDDVDPDDHGALWSSIIETGNHWRDTDSRRLDPLAWWKAVEGARKDSEQHRALTMGARALRLVAAAMSAFGDDRPFWQITDYGQAIVLVHCERDDLAIIAMKAAVDRAPGLPAWAFIAPQEPEHALA